MVVSRSVSLLRAREVTVSVLDRRVKVALNAAAKTEDRETEKEEMKHDKGYEQCKVTSKGRKTMHEREDGCMKM